MSSQIHYYEGGVDCTRVDHLFTECSASYWSSELLDHWNKLPNEHVEEALQQLWIPPYFQQ